MNLAEYFLEKSLNTNEHMLVISNGGTGKSFQLINTYSVLLNAENKSYIPLYIPLNAYDDSCENYILNMILKNFVGNVDFTCNISYATIVNELFQNTQYKYVLMLDGINETSATNPETLYHEIYSLSKFDSIKLIITSRYDINLSQKFFKRYYLAPINAAFLKAKIQNYDSLNASLKNLLKTQLYYKLFRQINNEDINSIDSDKELMDKYIKSMLNKLSTENSASYLGFEYQRVVEKLLFGFLPEYLSKIIGSRRYMIIDDEHIESSWAEYKRNHDINISKTSLKMLQEMGIIEHTTDDVWKFRHETYFDFFINKYFKNEIKKIENGFGPDIINHINAVNNIITFYDIKRDKANAYIYASETLNILSLVETIDFSSDKCMKLANAYIGCGYAVLHSHNEAVDAFDKSSTAFDEAEKILEQIKVDDQDFNLFIQKTLLHGDRGAYYYAFGNYKKALAYHTKTVKEREWLHNRIHNSKTTDLLAVSYKNVGSDYYQLAKVESENKNEYLRKSFENHYRGLNVYKDVHKRPTLGMIVIINRMIGTAIQCLKSPGFEIEFLKMKYGNDLKFLIKGFIQELATVISYFNINLLVYDEYSDCLNNMENLIIYTRKKNMLDEDIREHLKNFVLSCKKLDIYISKVDTIDILIREKTK